jgi:hypothetical protein
VQRGTAPQVERQRNRLRPGRSIAFAHGDARLSEQLLEAQGVHGRIHQRVSVVGGDDRLLPEHSA